MGEVRRKQGYAYWHCCYFSLQTFTEYMLEANIKNNRRNEQVINGPVIVMKDHTPYAQQPATGYENPFGK